MARKPRDYDAELQALMEKAKKVKIAEDRPVGRAGADHRCRRAAPSRPWPAPCSPRWNSRSRHRKWSRGGPNAVRRSFSKAASGRRGTPRPAPCCWNSRRRRRGCGGSPCCAIGSIAIEPAPTPGDLVQDRRARTRQLIELGGLVQKAGLVELVEDDRATLLGAFLELAARLQEDERQEEKPVELKARWRRSGPRLRRRAGRRRGGSGGREGPESGAGRRILVWPWCRRLSVGRVWPAE